MRKRLARHGAGRLRGAWPWIGAVAFALVSSAAWAASSSTPFRVNLQLLPPFKDTPDCGTVRQGANVSVTCASPGAPGNSQRYLLHVYSEGEVVGSVNAVTDAGTVTSWRVVRAADRDFLEIVVGW